jgi:hypothetical protein
VNGFAEIADYCVNGIGLGFTSQYALFTGNRRLLMVSVWISGSKPLLRAFSVKDYSLTPLSTAGIVPAIPLSMFMPEGFTDDGFSEVRRLGFEPRIAYTLPRLGTEIIGAGTSPVVHARLPGPSVRI